MLTIEDWFDEEVAPTEEDFLAGDGAHPGVAQILKDYLHGKTSPDETARSLVAPIFATLNPRGQIFTIWYLLAEALKLPSRDRIKFENHEWLYAVWFEEYTHKLGALYLESDESNSADRVSMLREHGQAVGTAEGGMLTRNLGDRNIWLYWGLQALNLGLTKDWRSIDIWIGKIHGLLVSAGDELYRGLETVDDSSYMANGPGEHRRGETAEITRRMRYQHWDDCRDALLRFGSEGTQLSDRSKEMASECSELMKSLPDATTTLRTGC